MGATQKSYQKINYRLRISKGIERKMLVEVLQRLAAFGRLGDEYQYVGFGSLHFADFVLFHKSLGLERMISIEHHEDDEARFDFNVPFSCVRVEMGKSSDVLRRIEWEQRSVVWLDYDTPLDESSVLDVRYLASVLRSGSVILVSVNCHPDVVPDGRSAKEYRLERLNIRLGTSRVPLSAREINLGKGWNLGDVYHRIIVDEIMASISSRNASVEQEVDRVRFHQLVHFRYQDGAKMITVGGIIVEGRDDVRRLSCGFDRLAFAVTDVASDAYEIPSPMLTPKEIGHLEPVLPASPSRPELIERLPFVPEPDVVGFAKIYRFFPNFAELE